MPNGDCDLPSWDADLDKRPLGDPDRDSRSDVRLVRVEGAGLAERKGRLVVLVCGDSSFSGARILGTCKSRPGGSVGGGDCTGSPSSVDVMKSSRLRR